MITPSPALNALAFTIYHFRTASRRVREVISDPLLIIIPDADKFVQRRLHSRIWVLRIVTGGN